MNHLSGDSYWSRYAAVYDEGVEYVVGRSLRLALAERLAMERHLGKVLECGCGTGFYTKVIAGHADQVTATDISAEMLDVAGHHLTSFRNVSCQTARAEAVPFSPRVFDTAVLANILNTVPDPIQVLRESFRVLKYNGLLIVIVYTDHGMEPAGKMDIGLRYFWKFGLPPSWGLHNFSPDGLRGLIRQAGFRIKSVRILGRGPKALYIRAVKSIRLAKSFSPLHIL